jgi:16S rRNA (guanine966-N2)-methyltransferase
VRVVGGEARGRRLTAPPGRGTRPTTDRAREAIFDMLGSLDAVEGADVVDLFSGSGALGIEALSRGARSAVFVEHDRDAAGYIRANLAATGLAGPNARVVTADVLRWLDTASPCSLALVDPPFAFDHWALILERLAPLVGLVVFEAAVEVDPGPAWEVLRLKHYGSSVVVLARPVAKGGK